MGPIGGFLALELPLAVPAGRSAWDVMTAGAHAVVTGDSARTVLARVLDALAPARFFVPAYGCREVAVRRPGTTLAFFPVDETLEPDAAWLADRLAPGDAVLAIDYFGRPPAKPFRDLVASRPEVFWIEDCAQALAAAPWGDLRLYSPRKIFGVPDGGLGVFARKPLAVAAAEPALTEPDRLAPLLWRMEDSRAARNALWFAAFRAAEARPPAGGDLAPLTRRLLAAIDADQVAAVRTDNARRLHAALPPEVRVWDEPPPAPLGVPVRLANRDAVAARLAARKIFCPVHWRDPPGDPATFPAAHRLAATLLTLPCDQRYGAAEMGRVADAVAACLSG